MEGYTHSYLELGSGKVDTRNHLSCRVLDLETRVQFQEVEIVFGMAVQVLRVGISKPFKEHKKKRAYIQQFQR